MTLNEIIDLIKREHGDEAMVSDRQYFDGSAMYYVKVGGCNVAEFKGRLVNGPVFDGLTPRGPKEYFDYRNYCNRCGIASHTIPKTRDTHGEAFLID